MQTSCDRTPPTDDTIRARKARLARRVAAVAGAAGAAVSGEFSDAGVTYVPTAGVVAAQGIPGFSFTSPATVTPGTLRPPSTAGNTGWDIDGNGDTDFFLMNYTAVYPMAVFSPANAFTPQANGLLVGAGDALRDLADAAEVGPLSSNWYGGFQSMTYNQGNEQLHFTLNQTGYFGFRFRFNAVPDQYYYGWASLTIDGVAVGQGFKIGEAFYHSTPNTPINVGAVPVGGPPAVPELPADVSPIALLAAGLFGVEARRRSGMSRTTAPAD